VEGDLQELDVGEDDGVVTSAGMVMEKQVM
jgi:hypothetical protein